MDIPATAPPLSAHRTIPLGTDSQKHQGGAVGQPVDPVRKAAQQFETMVLGVMLEPMFSGIKSDGPFGGGSSEKVYRSMLVQEYAKSISANGGIGLADSVYKEMLKMQELR